MEMENYKIPGPSCLVINQDKACFDYLTKEEKKMVEEHQRNVVYKKGETQTDCATRMKRVQVAWDTKMAEESAKLASTVLIDRNDKLLIFVGSMHLAYNLGVNMRFQRLSNQPNLTLLPQPKSERKIRHGVADYLFFYEDNTTKPDGK